MDARTLESELTCSAESEPPLADLGSIIETGSLRFLAFYIMTARGITWTRASVTVATSSKGHS
jgi:hypothetical protein